MNIRRILAAGVIGAGAVAGSALPAVAMPIPAPTTQTAFTIEYNPNGVLYTSEPLTVDQVVHSAGVWYTVRSVRPYAGAYEIVTLTPRLPASDKGHAVQFYT